MKTKHFLLTLAALALLPSLIASAQDTGTSHGAKTGVKAKTAPTLEAGALAPDFASKDIAGKETRISDSRKKIVVLDFWATWCGPCKASLPHKQEVAKHCKDQGVLVLAVCTSDTRANFEQFVKDNQAKYPDIRFTCDLNEKGSATYPDRASQKLYGVKGIPTQFVIGKDGKIAAVLVGYDAHENRLEQALAKLGVKAQS
jgi:thiol-disulfide isomerase/thioredoxin